MASRFQRQSLKDIATEGSCPVCLNNCWYGRVREGGRQLGMGHVGDRKLAIYGEFVWDTTRAVWWHSSNEPTHPTPYQDALSEMSDDISYCKVDAK